MDWLSGISITCFAASYLVVFALEISRIFFRKNFQTFLILGVTAAGLFAHSVFLVLQTQLQFDRTGIWIGNWSTWLLVAAWILVAIFVLIGGRKSQSLIGLFLWPVVLALIFMGTVFGLDQSFNSSQARSIWNMVHGFSLLIGTVIVCMGFVFGLMYLVQAYRLKHKVPHSRFFRLPSLEWLQNWSERSLWLSAGALAIGLISGIAINGLNDSGDKLIAWSDPVVWTSGILFAWLLIATLFNLVYQPARQGRKVAYLVVTSFLFLVLELGIVWWMGHGQPVENNVERQTAGLSIVHEAVYGGTPSIRRSAS